VKESPEMRSYVKKFKTILRKTPRGGWLTPSHAFPRKLNEANMVMFRPSALDVAEAREDDGQKLIDAVDMRHELAGPPPKLAFLRRFSVAVVDDP
jgi:hypothetical protein